MRRVSASLDTSFWGHAHKLRLEPFLFDYFDVFYCSAVRDEICAGNPQFPSIVYPNARLFTLLDSVGLLRHRDPEGYDRSLYSAGEAQALALAREHLELYQRGQQRLAERRPAEARERTIELPPLTETQARALVALIEREELAPAVRERAAAYEAGAAPGAEDLASLKAALLRALDQDNK